MAIPPTSHAPHSLSVPLQSFACWVYRATPAVQGAAAATLTAAVAGVAYTSEASCDTMATSLETIKSDLEKIKAALGISEFEMAAVLEKIKAVKISNPSNIAMAKFDFGYYGSLDLPGKKALLKIVNSGVENADSGMGCYAMK